MCPSCAQKAEGDLAYDLPCAAGLFLQGDEIAVSRQAVCAQESVLRLCSVLVCVDPGSTSMQEAQDGVQRPRAVVVTWIGAVGCRLVGGTRALGQHTEKHVQKK
jgi:hypothetical protein